MAEATDTAAEEVVERSAAAEDAATAPQAGAAPARETHGEAPQADAPQTVGEAISQESLQSGAAASAPDVGMVMRIPVTLQAVLGEARMSIARLMKLGPGSVVPLNRKVGDPVDVVVNGRLVARGEVVLLDEEGERFGISLTEIISPGQDTC